MARAKKSGRHVVAVSSTGGYVVARGTEYQYDGVPDAMVAVLEDFRKRNRPVQDIAFAPEGGFVVAAENEFVAWNVPKEVSARLDELSESGQSLRTLAFKPGGGYLFVTRARKGHTLRLSASGLDEAEHALARSFVEEEKNVRALAFSQEGGLLVVGDDRFAAETKGSSGLRTKLTGFYKKKTPIDDVIFHPVTGGFIIIIGDGRGSSSKEACGSAFAQNQKDPTQGGGTGGFGLDIACPGEGDEPDRPKVFLDFNDRGGYVIPREDDYLHDALPAHLRFRLDALYREQQADPRKSLQHLGLALHDTGVFVTDDEHGRVAGPMYGTCSAEPDQVQVMRALRDRFFVLAQDNLSIDALEVAPSGKGWILVSRRRIYTGGTLPAGLEMDVRSYVRLGYDIAAIAITPDGQDYVVVAGTQRILSQGVPSGVANTLDAFIQVGDPIDDVDFNPQTGGWVVVSQQQFHSESNSQGFCDDLTSTGRSGTCASPLPSNPPVFSFGSGEPTVVVLVHGITGNPREVPDQGIGTIQHPQYYWGGQFMRRLFGDGQGTLYTFNGVSLRASNFSQESDDWRAMTAVPENRMISTSPGNLYPAVMVTYRDGSRELSMQVKDAIDQVYETYTSVLDTSVVQPQIVFVGHSFGGIVTRSILSNPSSELGLSPQQCERADFLRDRTVSLATLATPHEGSPLALYAQSIEDQAAQKAEDVLIIAAGTTGAMVGAGAGAAVGAAVADGLGIVVGAAVGALAGGVSGSKLGEMVAEDIQKNIRAAIGADDPVMQELRPGTTQGYNTDILAPERAMRIDSSLIPIYTLSGRSPGADYFDSAQGSLDILNIAQRGRRGSEAVGLALVDQVLTQTSGSSAPWGQPVGGLNRVDWTARKELPPIERPWQYDLHASDSEYDSDGMVGFGSGHAFMLGGNAGEYFSHEQQWPVDSGTRRGSWYRVYDGRYGSGLPWDWEHHGSIHHLAQTSTWLRSHVLASGPYVGVGLWSVWEDQFLYGQ